MSFFESMDGRPQRISTKDLRQAENRLLEISRASVSGPVPVVLEAALTTEYTTDDLFTWIESFAKKISNVQIVPSTEELPAFEVSKHFQALKLIFERTQKKSRSEDCVYSVISVFKPGGERELKKCLESQEALAFAKERWESIVIIDGTYQIPLDVELSFSRVANIRVFSVAADSDTSLRRVASLRNLGASLARGRQLVFMDADFWASPLLLQLMDRMRSGERTWIQPIRGQSSKLLGFLEGAHWQKFREENFQWDKVLNPWLWASSYCFSVDRESFISLGGFDSRFEHYGFEDTELAYRWHKTGGRFQRLKIPVLHLEKGLWTFLRKFYLKLWGMRDSAERFYRLHRDPEIYRSLFVWMGPRPFVRILLRALSKLPKGIWLGPLRGWERASAYSFGNISASVKSRVAWSFARPQSGFERGVWKLQSKLRNLGSKVSLSWLGTIAAFFKRRYERNYQRLWGEEPPAALPKLPKGEPSPTSGTPASGTEGELRP